MNLEKQKCSVCESDAKFLTFRGQKLLLCELHGRELISDLLAHGLVEGLRIFRDNHNFR
jgi:hypothetical protein